MLQRDLRFSGNTPCCGCPNRPSSGRWLTCRLCWESTLPLRGPQLPPLAVWGGVQVRVCRMRAEEGHGLSYWGLPMCGALSWVFPAASGGGSPAACLVRSDGKCQNPDGNKCVLLTTTQHCKHSEGESWAEGSEGLFFLLIFLLKRAPLLFSY